jgi:hypothetical protein
VKQAGDAEIEFLREMEAKTVIVERVGGKRKKLDLGFYGYPSARIINLLMP